MRLTPLTFDHHGDLKLRPQQTYHFAAQSALISLYATEVPRGAQEFPISFTAEQEGFFPAALMGFEAGQNLFVDANGMWLSSYIPAVWRRSALRLAKHPEKPDWVVCIDEDSDLLSKSEGERLFQDDGTTTEITQKITAFLAALERDRLITVKICDLLDRHGLIVPWDFAVTGGAGETKKIEGLYHIDETKIADLSADALVELRNNSALPVLYGHLFSMHRLNLLGHLAKRRYDIELAQKNLAAGKLNLDRAFGIVEDDPFIF